MAGVLSVGPVVSSSGSGGQIKALDCSKSLDDLVEHGLVEICCGINFAKGMILDSV